VLKSILYTLLTAGCAPTDKLIDSPTATAPPAADTHIPVRTWTPTASNTPSPPTATATPEVPLFSKSPIVAVSAGSGHSLALRADGRVFGWGDASPLGLSGAAHLNPTILEVIEDVDAVFAAEQGPNTVFLQDGHISALNFYGGGQLISFDRPDRIIKTTSSQDNILALRDDGTLWGLGKNEYGELGNGTFEPTTAFTLALIDEVIDIFISQSRVFAVRSDHTLWWWGSVGQDEYRSDPEQLPEVVDMAFVSPGLNVHSDGSVTRNDETSRVVEGLPPIIASEFGPGVGYGYLLGADGTLWGWGDRWYELGIGPTPAPTLIVPEEFYRPKQVLISNVVAISLGLNQSLALDSEGTVWSWGYGELGDGKPAGEVVSTPMPIILSPRA
jgi:hypothetical protein